MVGKGKGLSGHFPSSIPRHVMLIEQQAHQFRHPDCRVSIIQLHGKFFVEGIESTPTREMNANHIL